MVAGGRQARMPRCAARERHAGLLGKRPDLTEAALDEEGFYKTRATRALRENA